MTTDWPVKELVTYHGQMSPGTTQRLNHEGCLSGEDRRRRLYVTKTDDNSALKVYCHNCGQGTVINLRNATRLRPVVKDDPKAPLELPPVWAKPPQPAIHPRHKLWLDAFGIREHAHKRGVYSMSEHELVFPKVQGSAGLAGYQIRYFDGRKPKWKSYGDPRQWWGATTTNIIVEDVVSAYKWHAATGGGYFVMAGHSNKADMQALDKNNVVVVWLDNDKPSVIEAAEALAKASKYQTVLIKGGTDPKRYPKSELKKVHDVCIELVKSPPPDGGTYHVLQILPPSQGVCP